MRRDTIFYYLFVGGLILTACTGFCGLTGSNGNPPNQLIIGR